MKHAVAAIWIVLAVTLARAGDGVTDIRVNPETGFTISQPGSYRLVGDVTVTGSVSAISITTGDVTLDLGGHTITGEPGFLNRGVDAEAQANITVTNGTIKSTNGFAVVVGENGIIRNVRTEACSLVEVPSAVLICGGNSVVENCSVLNSVWLGDAVAISTGFRCRVLGNIITGNNVAYGRMTGIITMQGSIIEGNLVQQNISTEPVNSSTMIWAGGRCIVRNNTVIENENQELGGMIGIYSFPGSLIEGNICSQLTSTGGGATGITATNSFIVGNECIGNTDTSASAQSHGISAGNDSRVERNRCNGNGIGIRAAFRCHVEGNNCSSSSNLSPEGYGIAVYGAGNLIAGNLFTLNGQAGLYFEVATNNRTERNRHQQTTPIDLVNGVAPSSQGTGDLADITY